MRVVSKLHEPTQTGVCSAAEGLSFIEQGRHAPYGIPQTSLCCESLFGRQTHFSQKRAWDLTATDLSLLTPRLAAPFERYLLLLLL